MSHTPTPWKIIENDRILHDSDQMNNGFFIADCFGPQSQENARRIVACVNACSEAKTEWLENHDKKDVDVAIQKISEVISERDELKAELESRFKFTPLWLITGLFILIVVICGVAVKSFEMGAEAVATGKLDCKTKDHNTMCEEVKK